jgi:hypothetical protein
MQPRALRAIFATAASIAPRCVHVRRPNTFLLTAPVLRWTVMVMASLVRSSSVATTNVERCNIRLSGRAVTGDGAGIEAIIDAMPVWGCLTSEVRNLRSVEIESESTDYASRGLTWHGLAPVSVTKSLVYKLNSTPYALQITNDPGLRVYCSIYSLFPRDAASTEALTHSLDEVIALASKVETSCQVVGLVGRAHEYCRGRNCAVR